jgi:RNA polymerase sigma-70 factor (ECF subfamily)
VYGLALRLEGAPAGAEDLTQEIFLNVWRALPSFQGAAAVETWVRSIAVKTSIDRFRAARNRESKEDGWDPASLEALPAECRLEDIDLERAITALPAGMRRMLVLHSMEGYALREIAEMFDVAIGTVQSQVFEARKKLRLALRGRA